MKSYHVLLRWKLQGTASEAFTDHGSAISLKASGYQTCRPFSERSEEKAYAAHTAPCPVNA